jgi:hypothetical protein
VAKLMMSPSRLYYITIQVGEMSRPRIVSYNVMLGCLRAGT